MKLSEKAHYALAAAQSDPSPVSGDNGGMLWNIKNEDMDDELSIFAGHTRFVSAKKGPGSSIASGFSGSSSGPHIPPYHTEPPFNHHSHDNRRMVVDSFQPRGGPPPPFQRSSHRMSWTAGDPAPLILRDEYAPNNTMPPPAHMNDRVQYSYSYDRSSRAGQDGGYGWSNQQPSNSTPHSYHPNPGPATIRLSPPQYQQSSPIEPYPSPHQHPHHRHPPPSQVQTQPGLYPGSYPGIHPPGGNPHPAMHNSELADLGLAARDSRLDERWSSFMQDSGLLDGVNFRGH